MELLATTMTLIAAAEGSAEGAKWAAVASQRVQAQE